MERRVWRRSPKGEAKEANVIRRVGRVGEEARPKKLRKIKIKCVVIFVVWWLENTSNLSFFVDFCVF
jgi:hypothetical protein